jgi:hypothetical protein
MQAERDMRLFISVCQATRIPHFAVHDRAAAVYASKQRFRLFETKILVKT